MSETRFGDLRKLRHNPSPKVDGSVRTAAATPTSSHAPSSMRPTGKRGDAEFERLTTYVRKDTKKAAVRKWQDETGKDMSDLVEHLLRKYLIT